MYLCRDVSPLEPGELIYRKQTLRDAVICVAWLKLTSPIYYIILYYFVYSNSKGDVSNVMQMMLLAAIPLQIIHGLILFLGAVDKRPLALDIALWLCLALASYNTVLGVLGAVYFIRVGHFTLHFVLVVLFALLGMSLFIVLCHDILVIFAYKQMLLTFPEAVYRSCSSNSIMRNKCGGDQ